MVSGYTLIELVIATAITGIVLLAMSQALFMGVRFNATTSTRGDNDETAQNISRFLKRKIGGLESYQRLSFRLPGAHPVGRSGADLQAQGAGFYVDHDSTTGNDTLILVAKPLSAKLNGALHYAFPVQTSGSVGPCTSCTFDVAPAAASTLLKDYFLAEDTCWVITNYQMSEMFCPVLPGNWTTANSITVNIGTGNTTDATFKPSSGQAGLMGQYNANSPVWKADYWVLQMSSTETALNVYHFSAAAAQAHPYPNLDPSTLTSTYPGVGGFQIGYHLGTFGNCPGAQCPSCSASPTNPGNYSTDWATLTAKGDGGCYPYITSIQVSISFPAIPCFPTAYSINGVAQASCVSVPKKTYTFVHNTNN